ncbi:MAG: AraC family transcriptional regulator, partial [Bacteroidota bacterium]
MSKLVIQSISQAHQALGLPKPEHPLVSVTKAKDFNKVLDLEGVKVIAKYYQIIYKSKGCGTLQ